MQTITGKQEHFLTQCDIANRQGVNSIHNRIHFARAKAQLKVSTAITELWQQKELIFLYYLLLFRLPLIFFEPLKAFKRKFLPTVDQTIKLVSHIKKKDLEKFLCDIFLRIWTEYPPYNLCFNSGTKLTKLSILTKTSALFYDRVYDIEFFLFKIKYHFYFFVPKVEKQKIKVLLLNYSKIRSIYTA